MRAAFLRTNTIVMSKASQPEPVWPESQTKGQRLEEEESARCRQIERRIGEHEAAHRAGVGRDAFIRACANLGMYPGTRIAIRAYLARETIDRECPKERGK